METERLSDSFAEIDGIIVKLTTQSFTPEIDGQIRSLKQHFVIIQKSNQELNDALNSKNKEIDDLHKEVGELKAKIGLEEHSTESAQKYDELCAALESKEIKIKKLEKQVSELNAEKEKLKERVKALEAEVMELTKRNTTLEKNVDELEGRIMCFEDELEEVKGQNNTLRKNLRDLTTNNTTIQKNLHDLTTNNDSLERKVEHLQRKIHVSDDDLVLGELCRRVQSMIFQKILPPELYDDKYSYKIKYMGECFLVLFEDDEDKINAANQAWTKLQTKLKWQKRDVKTMGSVMQLIQTGRNEVAHPELTEDILIESTQRMKDAGRLVGICSPENVKKLVSVWKQLKMMA